MLTEIRLIIPSDLLAEFDKFVESLHLVPTPSSDPRSDCICAAMQSYLDKWKGVKEKNTGEDKEIPLPRFPSMSALAALRGEYVEEDTERYKGGIR